MAEGGSKEVGEKRGEDTDELDRSMDVHVNTSTESGLSIKTLMTGSSTSTIPLSLLPRQSFNSVLELGLHCSGTPQRRWRDIKGRARRRAQSRSKGSCLDSEILCEYERS